MSRKFTFYGFVAAGIATTIIGMIYTQATSRLTELRRGGESIRRIEIRDATNTADLWLLIFLVAGVVVVIFYSRFITLKRRDEGR